jgi:hypothetical protein
VNERRFVLRPRGRLLSLTADELGAYLRGLAALRRLSEGLLAHLARPGGKEPER